MMSGISKENSAVSGEAGRFRVDEPDGQSNFYSDPAFRFTVARARSTDIRNYLHTDAYSAAKAFVQGELDIHGDIFEAIRYFTYQHHPALQQLLHSGLARLGICEHRSCLEAGSKPLRRSSFITTVQTSSMRNFSIREWFTRPLIFVIPGILWKQRNSGSLMRFAMIWRCGRARIFSM
jgi:hypothetical protein